MHVRSRGFSLIEMMVAVGISSIIALISSMPILQTISTVKENNERAESTGIAKELRVWMMTNVQKNPINDPAEQGYIEILNYGDKATFLAAAETSEGAPIAIRLNTDGSRTIASNAELPGQTNIIITGLNLIDTEAMYEDTTQNVTYYQGNLKFTTARISRTGELMGMPPEYIGGITLGVQDADGIVRVRSTVGRLDPGTGCNIIAVGGNPCEPDIADPTKFRVSNETFRDLTCPAGTMFGGIIDRSPPEIDSILCITGDLDCGTPSSGRKAALTGISHNNAVAIATCTNLPSAPPAQPAPQPNTPAPAPLPPSPTPTYAPAVVSSPGLAGGSDCPNPTLVDSYSSCIAAVDAWAIGLGRPATAADYSMSCSAPPASCYAVVVPPPAPVQPTPPPPPPPPPPPAPTCSCGSSTLAVDEYCGSFNYVSYGYNLPMEYYNMYGYYGYYGYYDYYPVYDMTYSISSVYQCTSTALVLLSTATMQEPSSEFWGSFVKVNPIGGNVYAY